MKKLKKGIALSFIALFFMSVTSNSIIIQKDTCTLLAQVAFNYAVDNEGADFPTATAYANIVYNNCKKTTIDADVNP